MHFTAQVRNVPASLCVSQPQTHPQHSRRAAGTAFHVTRQQKPYPKHPSLLFKFAKICMVGVKENIVNCTILLTPKSNFFCLVYLDFSVCFVVKQPTRVVVHKTAFESWEHSHPWRTDCACLRLVHDLKIEYRWWNLGSVNNKVVCIVLFFCSRNLTFCREKGTVKLSPIEVAFWQKKLMLNINSHQALYFSQHKYFQQTQVVYQGDFAGCICVFGASGLGCTLMPGCFPAGVIPDETKALSLLAPANAVAGLLPGGGLLPTPNPLSQVGRANLGCVLLHSHLIPAVSFRTDVLMANPRVFYQPCWIGTALVWIGAQ